MNLQDMKIPIAVVAIIIAQAFGIIWYVATLDSTVGQLNATVEEMRQKTAETSVAVLQSEVDNIKANITKLEEDTGIDLAPLTLRVSELESKVTTGGDTYISGGGGSYYDDYPLWEEVNQLHMLLDELNWQFEDMSYRFDVLMDIPYYDDSSLWYAIDDLWYAINDIPQSDNMDSAELEKLIYNFLDSKGSAWNKSGLKERIEALEREAGIKWVAK